MRTSSFVTIPTLLLLLATAGDAQTLASRSGDPVPILKRPARLHVADASLDRALQALHRSSGVNLLYSPSQLPPGAVSCACTALTVEQALDRLLTGTWLRFQQIEDDVVIVPTRATPPPSPSVLVGATSLAGQSLDAIFDGPLLLWLEQDSVVGTVVDSRTGQPIGGALIQVAGTSQEVVTGADGRFVIPGLAAGEVVLRIQRLGYRTLEQRVGTGSTDVRIALEESAIRLDELVVTGTAVATAVRAVPSPITIFTARDIEAQRVQRVDQLFRGTVPGAFAWENGPDSYVSSTVVRGTSSLGGAKFIKTYVDGVEIASPFYLTGLDPASIERIEILRGPQASTIYGAEALNGVMQIFTKAGRPAATPEVEVTSMLGVQQTKYTSSERVLTQEHRASVSGGGEAFSYYGSGAFRRVGEWLPEHHNQNRTLSGSMRARQGPFSLQLSGRYTEVEVGMAFLPAYAAFPEAIPAPLNEEARFPTTTLGAQISYDATSWWSHHVTLGTDMITTDHHTTGPRRTTPEDTLYTIVSTDLGKTSIGYRTTFQLPADAPVSGSLTLGTDQVDVASNQVIMLSATLDPQSSETTLLSGYRAKHHNAGYYAQGIVGLTEALFLTAGLRAERSDLIGSDYGTAWAPRAGLAYTRALDGVTFKVRGAYGKAIRSPLAFQLAGIPSANIIPNPLIGPEAQHGFDGGVELYFGETASLELTYYNQTAIDLIDLVVDGATAPPTRQYQNIGRVRNRGIEAAGSIAASSTVSLQATYALMKSEVKTLSPDYTGALEPGDEPLGIPKHVGGVTLSYTGAPGSLSLTASYVGTRTQMDYIAYYGFIFGGDEYRGSERAYWDEYPSFVKLGLRASRDISSRVTALLNVDNLTNRQRFEDINLNPAPGRAIMVGVRVR